MTLNHIHLGTKNLSQSVEFYTSVFDFKKKFEHGSGVFLENSSGFLIAIDPADDVPKFPSWHHLGFCLKSEQDVLKMYSKCKTLNVSVVRDLMNEKTQYASFFIVDPDGYKIEISWHNE
ncbi:MAG: VOC family protein [Bdellovibrionaceae bacterium]|nr:VOC family protein [Pseudobdellovibrionaceae bacterium]